MELYVDENHEIEIKDNIKENRIDHYLYKNENMCLALFV